MGAIQQTVICPLPGLEGVSVTYNLMATEAEINALASGLGQAEGVKRENVIVSVNGWPEGYGGDPFGPNSPLAFRVWALQAGIGDAVKAFVRDPFGSTA